MGQYAVIKVAGSDPEKFIFAFKTQDLPAGAFMRTSEPMIESVLRTELSNMGRSELEIDSIIQQARNDPERA